jgi:hypothetical protein
MAGTSDDTPQNKTTGNIDDRGHRNDQGGAGMFSTLTVNPWAGFESMMNGDKEDTLHFLTSSPRYLENPAVYSANDEFDEFAFWWNTGPGSGGTERGTGPISPNSWLWDCSECGTDVLF